MKKCSIRQKICYNYHAADGMPDKTLLQLIINDYCRTINKFKIYIY